MHEATLYLILAVCAVSMLGITITSAYVYHQRFSDLRDLMQSKTGVMGAHMDANHIEMMRRLDNLDSRMARMENHSKVK